MRGIAVSAGGLILLLLVGCGDNKQVPGDGPLREGGIGREGGTGDGPRSDARVDGTTTKPDLPPAPTKWVLVPSTNQPLTNDHGVAMLENGDVLIAGGDRPVDTGGSWDWVYTGDAFRYIAKTNSFELAGKLSVPRCYASATRLKDNRVLVVGGESDAAYGDPTVDIYDPSKPAASAWSAGQALLRGRQYHAALLLPSGEVLLTGGWYGDATLASILQYDPAQNAWKTMGPVMSSERAGHTMTMLKSGKVLITGGYAGPKSKRVWLDTMEIYDPSAGTITKLVTKLSNRKAFHTADVLQDGRVLLAGGYCDSFDASCATPPWKSVSDIYDPGTNTIGPISDYGDDTPYMYGHTMLLDGRLLLAGDSSRPEQTIAFAPGAGGAWIKLANLNKPRQGAEAVTLPDGTVLLVGGYKRDAVNNTIPVLQEAERFVP